MKSEQEIRKRVVQALDLIINCKKGCGSKPAGFYCSYCWAMDAEINLLAWALDQETELKEMRGANL